jgi:AAA ATPase
MLKTISSEGYREITKAEPVVLEDLVREFKSVLPYTVLLARVNGKYEELTFNVQKDSYIEFLDIRNHSADLAYQNSLSLMYLKAVRDVMGDVPVKIENSLNKGLYTEIEVKPSITEEQVKDIEKRMRQLAEEDIPIIREVYDRKQAIELWEKYNYLEKARLLRESTDIRKAKFYSIQGYRNFFYGLMVPSTRYISIFQLIKYGRGVLLRFPQPSEPDKVPAFVDDKNIYRAFAESKKWHRLLGLSYVPDLNDSIKGGKAKDLILLSEALHEKKIAEIADMITKEKKRMILIAGPSSSGKTTFAKRLCVQLRVNGLDPLYMGTDDYYLERHDSPVDDDGQYNFENLDALDINLFNDNMNRLLSGETVDLPEFDFMTGTKVFGRRITSIGRHQPIIIEGIHGLNDKLTERIADREKFKIYISPFTQLNIDRHNRVTTTDGRMIRRIVRDYEFRNSSAAETIAQWPKVRAGEDKNIFPYSIKADVTFNSALAYELSVLRKYAVPILKEVRREQHEYAEAVRLLKFIEFFDAVEDERAIPNNSIIREFIGGSIFVE